MAVDPTVLYTRDQINLAAAADVKVGQLVYWDSANSRLALADADALTTPAEWVVVNGRAVANGDIVAVSKCAVFEDADQPVPTLTTGHSYNPIYLSTTAGGITQTRPTGAADLRQIVGRPLSATKYIISIREPYEVEVAGELMETTSGEAALGSRTALDAGGTAVAEGIILNATTEYCLYRFHIPENAIKLLKAVLVNAEESATTETYDFDVTGAVVDETHNAYADDIDAQDIMAASAADDIAEFDAVAAFDAASVFRPGATVFCKVTHLAVGTGAGMVFGMHLTVLCV